MSHDIALVTWSKGHVFKGKNSYDQSARTLVWHLWFFCKWRYNVLDSSRDLARPYHWGVMQICERELLAMCHHADKLFLQRHCESGNMFLICHVTSSDMFKVGLSPSKKLLHLLQWKLFKNDETMHVNATRQWN